jgi:hypothetical protein
MIHSEFNNDSENEENYTIYEYSYEEKSKTRFNIIISEPYNETIHGLSDNLEIYFHYLVIGRFKIFKLNYINYVINYMNRIYGNYHSSFNKKKIEIAECHDLPSEERIAIIKTFWLKLIQRTWKNILKKRNLIIKKRTSYVNLHYREINGNWPKECFYYPSLRGMLSSLSNNSINSINSKLLSISF